MKPNKTYIALFIGLSAGFALGVLICEQFLTKISIIPGWQTTVSPNAMSIQALLFGLALIAMGMSLAQFIPFFKNYFTTERMEVLNIGIAISSIAIILGMAWDLFQAWYMQLLPESSAYYSRANTLFPLVISAAGTTATQLFWVEKIRRNVYWTVIISALIIIGTMI